MTDALARVLRRYGDPALAARYLPGLTALDMDTLVQGAMYITERDAGSDVGAIRTRAIPDGEAWRLWGEKWFCSNPDAGLALVLARPEGAAAGTRGLGLFLLPRRLPDGTPNAYRIVRLKEKLGTRALPTGEIVLEGARAWLVGAPGEGFRQMADMINMSRLSNGMRAAGLMRRALTEALHVARQRVAFGRRLVELPLMRRQLLKMMVATEAARSVLFHTAAQLARADAGDETARRCVRLLTPLIKFRACRDARRVAGDAMEVRGGCGYVEEWPEARLVREAHLGSIWEGTSNIVALDAMRAIRREDALAFLLTELFAAGPPWLVRAGTEAASFAADTARRGDEAEARSAASALYYAVAAAVLWREGEALSESDGDARRLLLAMLVHEAKLRGRHPLRPARMPLEGEFAERLLAEAPVTLAEAARLLAMHRPLR